jgi:hypothetical protein
MPLTGICPILLIRQLPTFAKLPGRRRDLKGAYRANASRWPPLISDELEHFVIDLYALGTQYFSQFRQLARLVDVHVNSMRMAKSLES